MAKIWIDADACPKVVREIIIKAALRTGVVTTFVANSYIKLPACSNIKFFQTSKEFDSADNEIVLKCQAGDLVVTQDLPLASDLLDLKAFVITPRGKPLTTDSIKSKLNMRDFNETLRASGIHTGGPPQMGDKEKQSFANQLDRWITKYHKTDKS